MSHPVGQRNGVGEALHETECECYQNSGVWQQTGGRGGGGDPRMLKIQNLLYGWMKAILSHLYLALKIGCSPINIYKAGNTC